MRNTIGEYVHLSQQRYQSFGIGRSSQRGMSYMQAYKQAKSELLSNISKTSASKLDLQVIEKLMVERKRNLGAISKGKNFMNEDILDEYFITEVSKHFAQKGQLIDFENMTPQSLGSLLDEHKINYNKKHKGQNQYFLPKTLSRFRNKIQSALSAIDRVQGQGMISLKEAMYISKEILQCQQALDQIEYAINQHGVTKIPKGAPEQIFRRYNQIISAYSLPSMTDIGALGELFAMYSAACAAALGEKEIKKMIQDYFISPTSQQRTVTTYELAGLSEKTEVYDSLFQNFTVTTNDSGRHVLATTGASQNTIDITVSFPEQQLLGSVKNVSSMSKPIHVLNGAPVTSLFNLVNTDFVNHYMNLLAFQTGFPSQLSKAEEVWEKAVAVRALSGARTLINGNLANTLIINEHAPGGQVKIFSISNLLNNILRTKQFISNYLDINLSHGGDFRNIKVSNIKQGQDNSYEQALKVRIPKIFSEIHAIKINASLLPNALKS